MDGYGKVIWYSILGLVALCVLVVVGYELDINVISPVARQDQLVDPSRTIGLRQDFHNKLTEVITADSNIIALTQKITNDLQHVSGYNQSQAYQDDQSQLTSLITIRSNAISAYNEQSQGVDTRQWNDICMPHSITNTTVDQFDTNALIEQLTQEKQQITAKDGIC